MSVYERIKRWREQRKEAALEQYETLSAEERAQVDELRDEHSPGRGVSFGTPKMADREMTESDR